MLTSSSAAAEVSFVREIIPLLTRHGCNSGACHGAAVGRGGFRLSLYGSNPDRDYDRIVFELEGRRVNPAHPDESLLFLKATETLSHGGGTRFDRDAPEAAVLLEWIKAGAPMQNASPLVALRVSPASRRLNAPGETLALEVAAEYEDGSFENVTQRCAFSAEDKTAVTLEPSGAATVLRRGRHVVLARYLNRVVPIELIVPLNPEAVPKDNATPATHSEIDAFLDARLSQLGLPVSPVCDDAAFLRRARLRLTGRLPEPDTVREFVADASPDKRSKLVERLIDSADFTEYWASRFNALLRIRTSPQDEIAVRTYHLWLKTQIGNRTSWHEIARQLLTATGDTHSVGPANFYRTVGDAREQAEFVSEVLLGVRLRCANCHDHPLDRWTQDDYHGLAAIFARVRRGRIIELSSGGDVSNPATGDAAIPRIPGTRFLERDAATDERIALAEWTTSRQNPYFARAMTNRLWHAVMGRGLVEPLDDLSAANLPAHPDVLQFLAESFVDHDGDFRHALRRICLSHAFARSSAPVAGNETDSVFFSHAIRTPLEPDVLADAISDVTGVPGSYGSEPPGTRAVGVFARNLESDALDVLGRCVRDSACDSSGTAEPGLPKALHLINGSLLNDRLRNPQGRLQQRLDAGANNDELIDEFYLRALSRFPTTTERQFWQTELASVTGPARRELALDFVWSLLTSREFASCQ